MTYLSNLGLLGLIRISGAGAILYRSPNLGVSTVERLGAGDYRFTINGPYTGELAPLPVNMADGVAPRTYLFIPISPTQFRLTSRNSQNGVAEDSDMLVMILSA